MKYMSDEMLRERQSELLLLYLRNMQRIKWRIKAIYDIKAGRRKTTYKQTNIEFCILQIRKILELIAFSSLVSDTDIYKERLNNIEKMWNARLILADIERIHPDFYPHPIVFDKDENGVWKDKKEPYLTRDNFVKVYEKCGKYLHEESPYKTEEEINNEYKQIWDDVGKWTELIIELLSNHIIRLYNQKDLFYISMDIGDNPPHGNIFTQISIMGEKTNG